MDIKKYKKLAIQMIQYFFVACVAAAVNILGFWVLHDKWEVHHILATVISTFAGFLVNFFLGRVTVFRKNARNGKKMWIDFFGVLSTASIGFVLDMLFMWLMVDVIGGVFDGEYKLIVSFSGEFVAKVISTGLVFVWNFFAQKYFVYRKNQKKSVPLPLESVPEENCTEETEEK